MNKPRLLARFDKDQEWLIKEIDEIAKRCFASRSTIIKRAMETYIHMWEDSEAERGSPNSKEAGSDST